MKYKEMGNTGLKLSAIGQGTWAMGDDMWGKVDDKNSINTIRKSIDFGVNLIDSAPAYGRGHSEEVVGKAIKGIRDKVVVSTKCGIVPTADGAEKNLKPESIRKEIEVSLRLLGTDVIDIYFMHWPDVNTPIEDSMAELMRLQKQGKIKHIGVSNFDIPLLEKAMKVGKIGCMQPPLSILSRDSMELIAFAKKNGIGVMTYGSLAAGMLTGKITEIPEFGDHDARKVFYPFFKEPMFSKSLKLVDVLRDIAKKHDKPVSNVAINWVIQQEGVTTALVGAMMPDQVEENALAGAWDLTADEIQQINDSYQKTLE